MPRMIRSTETAPGEIEASFNRLKPAHCERSGDYRRDVTPPLGLGVRAV